MKVVVSVSALADHLKAHTLMHVHSAIDEAKQRFIEHGCPHTFVHDIRRFREISTSIIVEYANSVMGRESLDEVSEFATVFTS